MRLVKEESHGFAPRVKDGVGIQSSASYRRDYKQERGRDLMRSSPQSCCNPCSLCVNFSNPSTSPKKQQSSQTHQSHHVKCDKAFGQLWSICELAIQNVCKGQRRSGRGRSAYSVIHDHNLGLKINRWAGEDGLINHHADYPFDKISELPESPGALWRETHADCKVKMNGRSRSTSQREGDADEAVCAYVCIAQ